MSRERAVFGPDTLLERVARFPVPKRYWVGFSGGADSTALLLALHELTARLNAPIHAVHFDHGLQAQSADWAEHCEAFCETRDIPFLKRSLEIGQNSGSGPEERARNARYREVESILGEREMYLTAHHADDQAETLFLNLMRGSGVEGLAGIPAIRTLGEGWVARPLLDFQRDDLTGFLAETDTTWLEDPSNAETVFDRNYLRNIVFPMLEKRWPGVGSRLTRTARNARISATALAAFIERQSGDLLGDRIRMPLQKLLGFDRDMQALVLRQWLRRHEVPALPASRLDEFLAQLSLAQPDAQPEVQWADWMIKQYRHELWLHRRRPYPACTEAAWTGGMNICLGPDTGEYRLKGAETRIPDGWKVAPRAPGGRIRTVDGGPSRKLKQFFQAASIPPWLRLGIPVLYWDDEPVALGDWVLGHRLQWWLTENDLELEWKPADSVLSRVRKECQQ